jgi:electron transport complex protein RnfE
MGLGFAMALAVLGSIRKYWVQEKFSGRLFTPIARDVDFCIGSGAFIALGYLIAVVNKLKKN